jgi:hypothetical protein
VHGGYEDLDQAGCENSPDDEWSDRSPAADGPPDEQPKDHVANDEPDRVDGVDDRHTTSGIRRHEKHTDGCHGPENSDGHGPRGPVTQENHGQSEAGDEAVR